MDLFPHSFASYQGGHRRFALFFSQPRLRNPLPSENFPLKLCDNGYTIIILKFDRIGHGPRKATFFFLPTGPTTITLQYMDSNLSRFFSALKPIARDLFFL